MTENDRVSADAAEYDESTAAGEAAEEFATIDEAMSGINEFGADGQQDATAPSGEPLSMEQLKVALMEANSRALRSQAELENFRKRTRREQSDQLKYAMLPLIRDLLPVMDNFERAMAAIEVDAANQGMIDGIAMVASQIQAVLQQHGCSKIPSEGEFDPMVHEAVAQRPSDECPTGHVLEVMQTGYQLHDRVVRTSQVVVSQGPGPK